ncbi:YitT family protein [Streptomyces sp. NPDC004327]|uniref:membrane protein YczE n=1 Tax=Streptomyces sp. NPDC004327 TaxID=3364699 RepID=UPI003681E1D5
MSIASGLHGRHLSRRLVQLYAGLALYGVSSALLVRGGLGLEPWGVLHQGIAERTGLSIGVVSIIVGAIVLLLWIPIRQKPGLGTVSNVFVIGLAMDGTLALLPEADGLPAGIALMVLGIVLNGVATGLYIAARFGPGPRDGLMTGLHRLTGRSIRLVRTAIEVAVVATGFLLGGSVGVGTVVYALAIGPLAQFFLKLFAVAEPDPGSDVQEVGSGSQDAGSNVQELGSEIQNLGSDAQNSGSSVQEPGSSVQVPELKASTAE